MLSCEILFRDTFVATEMKTRRSMLVTSESIFEMIILNFKCEFGRRVQVIGPRGMCLGFDTHFI